MDSELYNIACRGDVNRLYGVIAKNPYVLDNIDKIPFVETPLHVAASRGQTNFAVEIMGLKPSFSKKLNQQGWSPMHLAVQEKMKPTVLRFLETEHGADLVRVKGREGVTSLHYVVEQEDLELLNEFLSVSPDSINDTTNQGETALHIAVKNRKINALDALLVFLRRFCNGETEEKVLNWKDEKGYTVLHVAAESDQRDLRDKITKSLLKYNIHLNARSLSGSTALNILLGGESNDYTETKSLLTGAGASDGHVSKSRGVKPTLKKQLSYKSRLTFLGKLVDFVTKERKGIPLASRDTLLVVSALVATATFQAVLSPPGGLRQADSNSDSLPGKAGKVVMKQGLYILFLLLNTTSFCVTIITIFFLLPPGFYGRIMTVPLALLSACYLFSSIFISPSLASSMIDLCLFILLFITLLLVLVVLSNRPPSVIKKFFSRSNI